MGPEMVDRNSNPNHERSSYVSFQAADLRRDTNFDLRRDMNFDVQDSVSNSDDHFGSHFCGNRLYSRDRRRGKQRERGKRERYAKYTIGHIGG